MRKIYAIPGFGVDEKIFSNLSIQDAYLQVINWLDPLPKESLASYVQRMASYIEDENPVIIGISFGGMIAIEISKIRPVQLVIIISSVKTRKELPLQLKLIGLLQLNKIFPVKKIQQSEKFYEVANKRLGAVSPEERQFANGYRRAAKLHYVNWSFNQILNWRNHDCPQNVVHIHGEQDQIFPVKTIRPTHIIKHGTHMMVWNRADEISGIINETLKPLLH